MFTSGSSGSPYFFSSILSKPACSSFPRAVPSPAISLSGRLMRPEAQQPSQTCSVSFALRLQSLSFIQTEHCQQFLLCFFFFGNLGNKFWKPRLPSFFLPVAQPCRVFTRVRTRSAAQKVINISRMTRGNRFPPLMKTRPVLINHYVSIWTWKSGPDVLAARTKLCLPPHPTSGWEGGIWEPRPQKRVNYKNMLLRGAFKRLEIWQNI